MHHVEVDQSGKIGAKGPTDLAFSNEISYAIFIPAKVKRECVEILRSQGKTGKVFYLQMFSIALFLLLKDHIGQLSLVTIDPEYLSKDNDIKAFLLNLFWRAGLSVSPHQVEFRRIGKKSRAHVKAKDCLNGRMKPNKIVTTEEILSQFKRK